jgi:hypothetical protein
VATNAEDIDAETSVKKRTVERCLSRLKDERAVVRTRRKPLDGHGRAPDTFVRPKPLEALFKARDNCESTATVST